jgi:hypothetical protein
VPPFHHPHGLLFHSALYRLHAAFEPRTVIRPLTQPVRLASPQVDRGGAVSCVEGGFQRLEAIFVLRVNFLTTKGNATEMLMRRVAEINAIAKLQAMSQTKEFTQAPQAAEVPLKPVIGP